MTRREWFEVDAVAYAEYQVKKHCSVMLMTKWDVVIKEWETALVKAGIRDDAVDM